MEQPGPEGEPVAWTPGNPACWNEAHPVQAELALLDENRLGWVVGDCKANPILESKPGEGPDKTQANCDTMATDMIIHTRRLTAIYPLTQQEKTDMTSTPIEGPLYAAVLKRVRDSFVSDVKTIYGCKG